MRLCRVEPVILRDKTEVNSLAFSPDGERLASAGGDGAVKVWNSRTGKVIQTLDAHPGCVSSVAFHPDGKHLASVGADQQVKVWDLTTGRQVFAGPCDAVHIIGTAYAVAFSPDGRQLAAGSDGAVKVWDWRNKQLLHTFAGHERRRISVAFSRDGRRLASGSWWGSVKLWDAEAGGEPLRTFPESREARHPSARWRSARTAGGWPRPASTAAWTCGIRRPAGSSTRCRIADSFWASPSARTAGASPRPAKTRPCTSGTRRPAGRCSASADTPACAGAWRSARTAGASPRPAWTGPSASGTRPRSRVTRARKPLTFTRHSDEVWSVAVSPDGQKIASAGFGTAAPRSGTRRPDR